MALSLSPKTRNRGVFFFFLSNYIFYPSNLKKVIYVLLKNNKNVHFSIFFSLFLGGIVFD